MTKSIYHLSFLTLLLLATLGTESGFGFEFKFIQTIFYPTVIREVATYDFSLNRQMNKDLAQTNWENQPIPANSIIKIVFPHQYAPQDLVDFSCNFVMLDFNMVNSFSSSLNNATLEITITDVFPTDSNISFIDIQLGNIRNPSPSIMTDPFVVYVGNDYSANDSRASVFFDPAQLKSVSITFSNPTVNTTSDMIISVQVKNYFPSGGYMELTFPPTLSWSRDISKNHLFPIDGILSCEGVSANLNSVINCLGQRSTRIVAFTNIVSTNVASDTVLTFKLKNMFSPPTTETTNPSDFLMIRTYDGSSNQIEFLQSSVSGMQAKTFTNLQILPLFGQANFIVNRNSGLNFTFTLQDTVNFEDYFQMIFPPSTFISYTNPSTIFRLVPSSNYNPSNATLTLFQSSNNNPERHAGTNAFIGFVVYRVPRSTRVQNIDLKVMKYGYEKMIGSATVQAEPNLYTISSLGINQTKINEKTTMKINFQLKDPLLGSGKILVQIPERIYVNLAELSVECDSSLSSGTRIRQFPQVKYFVWQETMESESESTSLGCTFLGGCLVISGILNNVLLELAVQNITVSVSGLKNTGYVTDIGTTMVRTYYDSEWDSKVAQISQSSTTTLSTTSGLLAINGITFDESTTNFLNNKLSLTLVNQNPIPLTGNLLITIPSELFLQFSLSSDSNLLISFFINALQVFSDQMLSVTVNNSKFLLQLDLSQINFEDISSIENGSTIIVVFEGMMGATSTEPLSVNNWLAQSFTASMNLIDEFRPSNGSNLIYRTVVENPLVSVGMIRSSLVSSNITQLPLQESVNDCTINAQICGSYIFPISQQQPFHNYLIDFDNLNTVQIEIPSNFDLTFIQTAYISIDTQLVYADTQKLLIYKQTVTGMAQWIQVNFNLTNTLNNTKILSITLPFSSALDVLSATITKTTINRLQIPPSITKSQVKSSFYLLLENVKNPFSLSPFTVSFRTLKSVQNINTYIYSSAVSSIYKNSELMELSIGSYDFSNKYFSQQSTLKIQVSINNWNEISSTLEMRNKMRNNVKYIILAMGSSFSFNNMTSLGSCYIDVLNVRQSVSCTIEEISPNFSWTKKINSTGSTEIINVLSSSKYLVVFTLSDTLSGTLQTGSQTDFMKFEFGPVINPSVDGESLSTSLKSVSIFTLTQLEYLIHKSLLQIVFSSNCLSPCKECIFETNSSSEISSRCKSCYSGSYLYNKSCVNQCPEKTFESSMIDEDNITTIGICVDCPTQCGSCLNSTSCTECDPSTTYKYQIYNSSTNTTDCLRSCPINGYFQNTVSANTTQNSTQNTTQYECSTCKTSCSICTQATDCYKCSGALVLSTNQCIQTCPSSTIQTTQTILFKNTTIDNVIVCLTCLTFHNDSNCQYCNTTECLACSNNYSLDYLKTKKCLSQCSDGYYSVDNKVLTNENYTYSVCEMCAVECATCDDEANNCQTCKWVDNVTTSQYYQLENTCYLASSCPSAYFPDPNTKTCFNCSLQISGCLTCSSDLYCTDCNQTAGYYNFTSLDSQNRTTSVCLRSSEIPAGFLLINGSIEKCKEFCSDCSVGVNNCTNCVSGYYLFNLDTDIGTCVNQCPDKYYPANAKLCTVCPYPCELCQVNQSNITKIECVSCQLNSSLYLYQRQCIQSNQCPNTTYPYTDPATSHKSCQLCVSNCHQCQDDGNTCLNCAPNFYFYDQTCLQQQNCPIGTVAMIDNQTNHGLCVRCASSCKTCNSTPDSCNSCIINYYLNTQTNQCLSSCPLPLIQNTDIMQCVSCTPPCNTCLGSTNNCTSCIQSYYRWQSSCVGENGCVNGYYADPSSKNCEPCPQTCFNCSWNALSSQAFCHHCKAPYALFEGACDIGCPQSKQYNVSGVCMNCTQAVVGCLICTYISPSTSLTQRINNITNNQDQVQKSSQGLGINSLAGSVPVSSSTASELGCGSCGLPYIFLNNSCALFCPSGHLYKQQTNQCITVDQQANAILSQSLTTPTIMPLPFTIISCIIIVACVLSKLQNQNTYFVGTVYSFLGIAETVSVAYFLIKITTTDSLQTLLKDSYNATSLLFFIVLTWIYATNVLAFLVQSYLLSQDGKFKKYQKKHCFTFVVVSIISTLTNYKFKLIVATRLFNFSCFKSQLQSVQKFNIFNLFSFIGIGHQGLLLYIVGLTLARFKAQLDEQMILDMVDLGIIAALNCVLAMAVSKKQDDFFYEKHQGIILRKTFNAGEDSQTIDYHKEADTSKASINQQQSLIKTGFKNTGSDSNQNIMPQISQDDEFSLSISRDDEQRQSNIFDDKPDKKINQKQRNSSEDDEGMKSSSQLKNFKLDNMKDLRKNDDLQLINKSVDLTRSRHTLQHLKNLSNVNKSSMLSNQKKVGNQSAVVNKINNGLGSLNDKYDMEGIKGQQKGERSEEKLKINDLQNLNGDDFINQNDQDNKQGNQHGENENNQDEGHDNVKSQLDNLYETQQKELPQDYDQAVNQGWEIDEASFHEDEKINIFEGDHPEQDDAFELKDIDDTTKEIKKTSVIKVKSNLEPNQNNQNAQIFNQFNQSPIQKSKFKEKNQQNISQINSLTPQQIKQSPFKHNQSQKTQLPKQNQDQNQLNSNLITNQDSNSIQVNDNVNKKEESPKKSQLVQDPSSIKSNHKANNFFNEPLDEQKAIKDSLLEQKERELANLRKSRQDLQQQTNQLKKRSRSRSKSINKPDKYSKNESLKSKPSQTRSNDLEKEESLKVVNMYEDNQHIGSKQKQMNSGKNQQNKQQKRQRLTAQEIFKLGSQAPIKSNPHYNQEFSQEQEINEENQIILFDEPNQTDGEQDKIIDLIGNTGQRNSKSISNNKIADGKSQTIRFINQRENQNKIQNPIDNQRQSEFQKDKINHLVNSRFQRKSSNKKLPSQQPEQQITENPYTRIPNIQLDLTRISHDNQDKLIHKKQNPKPQNQLQKSSLKSQSNANKIDLGQFTNQTNQIEDQPDYRRADTTSASKTKRNDQIPYQNPTQNHQSTQRPNPVLNHDPKNKKNHEISSLDRISPSKMRPPTSKPINQFHKGQLPPHDNSFMSGKPAKSSYPLHNKNKEIGSEKDDSQVQVSFYHTEDNGILGDNSFQYYQKQYGSNDISSQSSRLRDQGGYGNTQPTKPITIQNQRFTNRKLYQNDQLSRLISKNVNPKIQSSRIQRQSIDKGTIPRGPTLRTERRSQERNQSAKNRQNSIEKNQLSFKDVSEYDALNDYYNRGRRGDERDEMKRSRQKNEDMKRSRSKSRERPMSKESENKLKALEKIYLQKLEWKK